MRRWLYPISAFLVYVTAGYAVNPARSPIPRELAILITSAILLIWIFNIASVFRKEGMRPRQKLSGWLFVLSALAIFAPRLIVGYHVFGRWLTWWEMLLWFAISTVVALLFAFAASHLLPKERIFTADTYTVESETPEHVYTVHGANPEATYDRDVSLR